jgi:hypothetical protein
VDKAFRLRSFRFSLDPGTGAIEVAGSLRDRVLELEVAGRGGRTSSEIALAEEPVLALNLPRRLAAAGLRTGARLQVPLFDPATLRNSPASLVVGPREVVRAGGLPVPAFRVEMEMAGVRSVSWVTDTGEVVREESPMGLMVVSESAARATMLAVPGDVQVDLLEAAAVVPSGGRPIHDPGAVERLRLRVSGIDLADPDVPGGAQSVRGDEVELVDPAFLRPAPAPADLAPFLRAEPFIESDDPEVAAEARRAVEGAVGPRERAERLVRHVHALLEKKPTVSLPSAREVLRTRVGDCNEHTALYVALARSLGLPARVAVGLVHLRGAFFYHAWPEVFLAEEGAPRGLWLPVDPTLNQFPADATHFRLKRGGLDRQAAILPLIGRARLEVLALQVKEGSTPVLVGRASTDLRPLEIAIPRREKGGCWSTPGGAARP